MPYSYAGTMGLVQGEGMAQRFFHKLGASLLDRTICSAAGGDALAATYGAKIGMQTRFFAESKLIVIWGSNSIASNLHFWTLAQEAKRRGAKLIAIDPRRTETAEKCHQHIALLPGTDGALALGVMHELIAQRLARPRLHRRVTSTASTACKSASPSGRPSARPQVCGITADEVRGLARDLGTTQPAAIRLNYGMQRVRGGGNATRLIALLPCLTGAWRHRAGGLLLSSSGWFKRYKNPSLERPDLLAGRRAAHDQHEHDRRRPAARSSPAFGPKIEALIVYNSNPVAVAPESKKVVAGFAREDLFTVVLEHFMTDTADHADYVLPATTQLEHLDVHGTYGHTDVMLNEPAIAPIGEAKPNTQIFRELAARMGFTDPCFEDDDETLARQAFDWDAIGTSFEALRERGWASLPLPDAPFADGGFATENGKAKVDVCGLGVPEHVPNYESVLSSPELAQRFPLAMISPPARHFLNSSFVNVKSLRDDRRRAAARDARRRCQRARHRERRDGARLQRARRVPLQVRGECAGAAAASSTAWACGGASSAPDGTNVNELTSQRLTDIGRAPTFYDCLVEVATVRRWALMARHRRCGRGGADRRGVPDGGLFDDGLLRAIGRRPPRPALARETDRRVDSRGVNTRTAARTPRAGGAHPRLRGQRSRPARQPQLPPLQRPRPQRRRVQRDRPRPSCR